jgi:DNA-directed RNA polymerase sigma subunit (sigma70/sigma32)
VGIWLNCVWSCTSRLWCPRERQVGVIRLSFGLVDGQSPTFEEIGQVFRSAVSGLRQIPERAMSELRKACGL